MNHFKNTKFTDYLIGLVFTSLFISLGVIFTINFRPLYYLDVKLLNIANTSGLSKEAILENYNALIDFCSPFFRGSLSFPSLIASNEGLQHFDEVKDIFMFFYLLFIISLPTSIIIIGYKLKQKDFTYLFASFITSIFLPIIVGGFILINFDASFIIFHKLFFNNDYWIFDPVLDPVINILPEEFFLHCGLVIIFIVLTCSFISYFVYYKNKPKGIKNRKINHLKI